MVWFYLCLFVIFTLLIKSHYNFVQNIAFSPVCGWYYEFYSTLLSIICKIRKRCGFIYVFYLLWRNIMLFPIYFLIENWKGVR